MSANVATPALSVSLKYPSAVWTDAPTIGALVVQSVTVTFSAPLGGAVHPGRMKLPMRVCQPLGLEAWPAAV